MRATQAREVLPNLVLNVADSMNDCLKANDPSRTCGYHHATSRPTGGGGFWCCCGRYWAHRLGCCNNFPTFSVAGDPVTSELTSKTAATQGSDR